MRVRSPLVLALALLGGAHGLLPSPALRHVQPRRVAPCAAVRLAAAAGSGSSSSSSSSSSSTSDGSKRRFPLLQNMRRKLRSIASPGDGSRPLPMWVRRWQALLVKLRPLQPFIVIFILSVLMGMRRARAIPRPVELSYAMFMSLVETRASSISDMRISLTKISFLLDGQATFTRPVRAPTDMIWFLHRAGVDFRAAATSAAAALLPLLFPCLWLAAVYSMMRRQMGGATGSVGKKASSSLRLSSADLSFDDVAGIDTAKAEVQEIVSMLKSPETYAAAGARLPAGVLMVGPPGTGKTLLARVMAAQADVPFFYCSGSDFVELFVGRGAARMRALFKEAAAASPCLIFVDELDALGKQRSLRLSGSNDEVEQTLNQMLACMDGVETSNNGVVVMGATNRYEILDPALTRPGRFDRLVRVDLPTEAGRAAILGVHTRKLKLSPDVDLRAVAEATPSYSGAELAALANEGAIRAVRRSSDVVTQADLMNAVNTFNAARRRLPSVDSLIPSWLKNGADGSGGANGGGEMP